MTTMTPVERRPVQAIKLSSVAWTTSTTKASKSVIVTAESSGRRITETRLVWVPGVPGDITHYGSSSVSECYSSFDDDYEVIQDEINSFYSLQEAAEWMVSEEYDSSDLDFWISENTTVQKTRNVFFLQCNLGSSIIGIQGQGYYVVGERFLFPLGQSILSSDIAKMASYRFGTRSFFIPLTLWNP